MGHRTNNWHDPSNCEPKHEECKHDPDECKHDHNRQKHVHELLGSTKIAEREEDPHNHRFATVTGEAIPSGPNDHFHEVTFRTDFFEEHFHEFRGRTGGAIRVGDRHVHFIESLTTVNDGHRHEFEAATLINNPIGEDCEGDNRNYTADYQNDEFSNNIRYRV